MTTLRKEIQPLLEEFAKANGKGNITTSNLALMKIIDMLVSHIERQQNPFMGFNFAPNAAAAPAPAFHNLTTEYYIPNYGGAQLPTAAANPPITTAPWSPVAGFETGVLTAWPSPPPASEAVTQGDLKAALETLHEANYVIGIDYEAIKEHIDLPESAKEAQKNAMPDTAAPVRKKPGRKPKNPLQKASADE